VLKIVTDHFPIWIESRHLQTLFSGIFFAKIRERKGKERKGKERERRVATLIKEWFSFRLGVLLA
jgi:hypothetical protein